MVVFIFCLSLLLLVWLVVRINRLNVNVPSNYVPYVPSYKNPDAVSQRETTWSDSDLAFHTYEVVGVHIAARKNHILYSCKEGDYVELKHEKTNKYSNRAIMVRCNGKKIGYIPEVDLEDAHEILNREVASFIIKISDDYDFLSVYIKVGYTKKPGHF